MKNKLAIVAEAIMDSAAEEYRSDNLASVSTVQMYAENGMNIYLNEDEAQRILSVCRSIVERLNSGEIPDTKEWYYTFTAPLSE